MSREDDQIGGDLAERRPIRLTFGEMEARLSRLHEIASAKRTQFQARLRNFQRMGIPAGVGAGRGKAVLYRPGHIIEIALALELTQLGLLPERVAQVFGLNKFPMSQAVMMAARAIIERGGFRPSDERADENSVIYHGSYGREGTEENDPLSMFLYFDPTALASLTDIPEKYEDQASATFFYGGAGIVRENIVKWTAGPYIRRLSLINVTAVLWELVKRTTPDNQRQFCAEVADWAEELQVEYLVDTAPEEEPAPENMVRIETYQDVLDHADLLRNLKGVPRPVADAMIERARQKVEEGKPPDPDTGLSGKPINEMSPKELEDEIVARVVMGGTPEFVIREALRQNRTGEKSNWANVPSPKMDRQRPNKRKTKRRPNDGDGQ